MVRIICAQCGKDVNDMSLGTSREKSKGFLESLRGEKYKIIKYYKPGDYYVRREPKKK